MHEVPLAIARDHPAFEGHFPGRPVVPAVVLLAEVLAQVAAATGRPAHAWTIAQAKFLRPVEPGAALLVRHERLASGQVRFEVRAGDAPVASGQLAENREQTPLSRGAEK